MTVNIRPDWTEMWTAAEAENKLSENNFKFRGPGWYHIESKYGGVISTTMLAVPTGRLTEEMWYQRSHHVNEKFYFYIYDQRDPTADFNLAVNAPVRAAKKEQS